MPTLSLRFWWLLPRSSTVALWKTNRRGLQKHTVYSSLGSKQTPQFTELFIHSCCKTAKFLHFLSIERDKKLIINIYAHLMTQKNTIKTSDSNVKEKRAHQFIVLHWIDVNYKNPMILYPCTHILINYVSLLLRWWVKRLTQFPISIMTKYCTLCFCDCE